MSQYNETHSVIFINSDGQQKNSWTDWCLIPSSRPIISTPPVQDFSLKIPGKSGKIDYQDYIFDVPVFDNRTGSLEFVVDHDNKNYISWINTYSTIMKFLHGRRMKLILQDDPNFYYEGRLAVNQFKSNADWSTITIDYDLDPFKRQVVTDSFSKWLWDPFNFITGHIREGADLEVYLNNYQEYTQIDIPDSEFGSEIELVSNDSGVVYSVVYKNSAGYDTTVFGNGKEILTFELNPKYPWISIRVHRRPMGVDVKFYIKVIKRRSL